MEVPFVTPALVQRLRQREIDGAHARQQAVANLPGNPYRASAQVFGSTIAVKFNHPDMAGKNRVMGLCADSIDQLDDILDFYRRHDIACSLYAYEDDFADQHRLTLMAKGVYQTGTNTTLYGLPPVEEIEPPAGVNVVEAGPQNFDLFMDLFRQGNEFGPASWTLNEAFERAENSQSTYHLYIAYLNAIPAAVASLNIAADIGSLAAASTLPTKRRHGCQSALIHHRLRQSALAGCDLVLGNAAPFSSSRHNMERAGLRLACYGSSWRDGGE
ncbi:MAG: hypothetical protein GKR89_25550 [Candidatus Latescibacteria bacterium]|nr:hypothetical protein [Candidatus Latescibacterota bacterium]